MATTKAKTAAYVHDGRIIQVEDGKTPPLDARPATARHLAASADQAKRDKALAA